MLNTSSSLLPTSRLLLSHGRNQLPLGNPNHSRHRTPRPSAQLALVPHFINYDWFNNMHNKQNVENDLRIISLSRALEMYLGPGPMIGCILSMADGSSLMFMRIEEMFTGSISMQLRKVVIAPVLGEVSVLL
jgi:hypothetical protein